MNGKFSIRIIECGFVSFIYFNEIDKNWNALNEDKSRWKYYETDSHSYDIILMVNSITIGIYFIWIKVIVLHVFVVGNSYSAM